MNFVIMSESSLLTLIDGKPHSGISPHDCVFFEISSKPEQYDILKVQMEDGTWRYCLIESFLRQRLLALK